MKAVIAVASVEIVKLEAKNDAVGFNGIDYGKYNKYKSANT